MKLKKSLLTLLSIQLFLLGTESLTSTTGPFTNTQLYSPVADMKFSAYKILKEDSFLVECRNGQGNLDVSINTHFDIMEVGNDTILKTNQELGILIPYRMDVFIGASVNYKGGWFNVQDFTKAAYLKTINLSLTMDGFTSTNNPFFSTMNEREVQNDAVIYVNPIASDDYLKNSYSNNKIQYGASYYYTKSEARNNTMNFACSRWENLDAHKAYSHSYKKNTDGTYKVISSEFIDYKIYEDEEHTNILSSDSAGPGKNQSEGYKDKYDYYYPIYGCMYWKGNDVLPKSLKFEMTFESGLGDSSGYRTRFEYTNSGSYEYNF